MSERSTSPLQSHGDVFFQYPKQGMYIKGQMSSRRALPVAFPVPLVRFPPVTLAKPLTVECRLIVTGGLLGEAAVPSRCRSAVLIFKLVTGGSGSGLPVAGVVVELNRFMGDSLRF